MSFLTKLEGRAMMGVAGIYALRMLGLFMILPVFAVYARQLNHATPLRVGIALGIYGLTQALLQIPFGVWSDRLGRKPMIITGLVLFSVGSMVAALSDSIVGVGIGRALQGAGAVGGVMMALVADLTREAIRTRAMAGLGMTIGLSFALAMVLGPLCEAWIGVQGIFWLSAGMGLLGMGVLLSFVPAPSSVQASTSSSLVNLRTGIQVLCHNPDFIRSTVGILILHATLTALFLKMPRQGWLFYLSVLLLALSATVPLILYAEKHNTPGVTRRLLAGSVWALLGAESLLFYGMNYPMGEAVPVLWALGLWLFFTAFNFLEASLPSLVSKCVSKDLKGTALGIFSSAQFLGLFLGGAIAGWLDSLYGIVAVGGFCGILAVVWLRLI